MLQLVDLAGSERAKESGSAEDKQRFEEMKSINGALSNLRLCISSLHFKVWIQFNFVALSLSKNLSINFVKESVMSRHL